MIPLLILIGVLLLLLLLPVGVLARYDSDGACVVLLIGPYRRQLYPTLPGKPKAEQPPKKKKAPKKKADKSNETKGGGSILDFWPFVELIWSFLGAFRRKLLLKELTLQICFGGEDAAQTAMQYGSAQGVVAAVYPRLRQCFRIRRERIGVCCDFTAKKMAVIFGLHIRLRIVDLLHLGICYGFRALRTYQGISKKRKALCQTTEVNPTIKNKAVQ